MKCLGNRSGEPLACDTKAKSVLPFVHVDARWCVEFDVDGAVVSSD